MISLQPKYKYRLGEILDFVLSSDKEYILDNYDLYVNTDDAEISIELICYLSNEPIEIDDNGKEVYPTFVYEKGLEYFCAGQLLDDVIANAKYQTEDKKNLKPLTNNQLAISLSHYLEYDSFLQLYFSANELIGLQQIRDLTLSFHNTSNLLKKEIEKIIDIKNLSIFCHKQDKDQSIKGYAVDAKTRKIYEYSFSKNLILKHHEKPDYQALTKECPIFNALYILPFNIEELYLTEG